MRALTEPSSLAIFGLLSVMAYLAKLFINAISEAVPECHDSQMDCCGHCGDGVSGEVIHCVRFGDPSNGMEWRFTNRTATRAAVSISRATARGECGLTWQDASDLLLEIREKVATNVLSEG